MTMGDRIHTLRKDKGLTLEDIGRAAGVAKSTVRKWESGSITSIRTDKVQKVAAALDTTLEYLLNGVTDSGALYGWNHNFNCQLPIGNSIVCKPARININ